MKFGGTSVADAQRISRAARRAIQKKLAGDEIVMVVSAMGKTTDKLIGLAREITDAPPKRELDMLLTTGEQVSISLMAMAIHAQGHEAISLTGGQIGLVTDAVHTKAKIHNIDTSRIREELSRGRIVIAAGFQGIDQTGEITTLGRGASDTTAVALAAVLEASYEGLSLRVHPAFVKADEPLAQVTGAFNAMSVFGREVGHTSYYGQGAGEMPTASAVVGDIIEVARGNSKRLFESAPAFGQAASKAVVCKPEEIHSRFYLRLEVVNRPGVLAQITRMLGDLKISISACLQHEGQRNDSVPLVIMTEEARQGNVSQALKEIEGLEVVKDKPVCIHVVTTPVD